MRSLQFAFVIVLTLMLTGIANAEIITFSLDEEYSGGASLRGLNPWLTATFDDGGTVGSVLLTLDADNLVDREFVGQWLFDLDPDLDPKELVFGSPIKDGYFSTPQIRTGENDFNAPGGRRFDILFDFSQSHWKRFGAGESMMMEISGIDSLTADSFAWDSAVRGNNEPLLSIAHIQSIGRCGRDSGWIGTDTIQPPDSTATIPEPTMLVLLAMTAITSLVFWRRRQ